MRSPAPRWRPSAVALSLAVALSACGDDGASSTAGTATTAPATTAPAESATTAETAAFPVTVTGGNGEVTVEARPEAVVSLSPTATEMLFAVGAGEQVIAVDNQSTYPDEAPRTDLSGFEPNVEAIAGYQPDLVLTDGTAAGLTDSLQALDITVLELPAAQAFDDVYTQLEAIGAVTGHADAASEVAAGMQADIDAIVTELPDEAAGLTYYHELDDTLYSVTSGTFIGQVYATLGLENVADAADPDGAAFGYPQLSAEYLIAADPDMVFLADTVCCGQSAETVAARPGWDEMTAVQRGAIFPLDDSIASRWGPRVVDLLRAVASAVSDVVAAAR